jgi:hypothetical protein
MSDSNFLGGMIGYQEGGKNYNVTFRCEDFIEQETGIVISLVIDIEVTDQLGEDSGYLIDVDTVSKLCYNHASNAIVNITRSQ